jgi:hypothetical protein
MQGFTHILQKTGVLKTFTVAKIVKKQDIDDLKKLIKDVASDENEYKQLLSEELAKLSNMHDVKNPIPGIIYGASDGVKHQLIKAITVKFSQNLKQQKFDKKELAFLITAIINELELTQEDFQNLKKDLDNEDMDDEDEDEDDEF